MNENQQKTTDRQRVEAWARKRGPVYDYLMDFCDNGAHICEYTEDSIALMDEKIRICYAAGPHCTCPELRNSHLVLTDSRELAETLQAEGVYPLILEVTTAIYRKQEPVVLERPGITTRPLTLDDLPFVLDNYDNPGCQEDHIRERIAAGMIGGVIDGQLAGFVGIHEEGAMGLLQVQPEFRRRGLAEVLEAAVINLQLERGRLPYCHIRVGNDASTALQKKMGLTLDSTPLFWVG